MNQFLHAYNDGLELFCLCGFLCVIELRRVCDFVPSAKLLEVLTKEHHPPGSHFKQGLIKENNENFIF